MGFAARINNKSRQGTFLPVLKYADLAPTQLYDITRAKRLTTEFGPTIVIDLNNEYSLFLPKRTVRCFDGDEGEQDFQSLLKEIQARRIGFRKSAEANPEFVDLTINL